MFYECTGDNSLPNNVLIPKGENLAAELQSRSIALSRMNWKQSAVVGFVGFLAHIY